MEMNKACELCRGACCEAFLININISSDFNKWLSFHGEEMGKSRFLFELKCCNLKNGKCDIYEDRPEMCKEFGVGSEECQYAITRYRPKKAFKLLSLVDKEKQSEKV
jgi:Fe-S-cluster containining protein